MRVNIVGWYGNYNVGDEAFRQVFSTKLSEFDLTFSEKPDLTADAIILGGGGVVRECYLEGLDTYKGLLFALGVDIDLSGMWWDRVVRLPFRHLYVRSHEYVQIARKSVMNVSYCPDLAFAMTTHLQRRKRQIGVILSHDLRHEHLGTHVANALSAMDFDPVFINFYLKNSSDRKVNESVASKVNRPCVHVDPQTPDEAARIISALDFVISMRFHGTIFSVLSGIPFVSLANKGKCSLFCEQEHLFEHFVELSEVNDCKLMNRVRYIDGLANKRDQLLSISARNRSLVDSAFQEISLAIKENTNGH
jgi:hypothetical protein